MNKPDQHDCRENHIHGKERADPVGEQLTKEQPEIQTVLQDPRHEL